MSTMKVVYQFTTNKELIGLRYATLEAIDQIKGVAIKGSLWTVDAEYVDGDGFYCGPPLKQDDRGGEYRTH